MALVLIRSIPPPGEGRAQIVCLPTAPVAAGGISPVELIPGSEPPPACVDADLTARPAAAVSDSILDYRAPSVAAVEEQDRQPGADDPGNGPGGWRASEDPPGPPR